ncbi:YadA-like family protein [Acinetobacter baumannii]
MNKIYKVVWNASIGTWIVVSELAKSKTRTGSVSSSSEITGSQNEIVSKEKKFRPKALVLSIISCLAVSHVWADYTNLYGSIIDTSPTISNGIAIGANTGTPATANDSNGLAVGSRANASAADSTALGNYVNATGVNSTVVGGQASAAGAQSIALQNNSDADLVAEGLATGSSFTAVDSASSYSVAIGAMSQVVGSTAAMAIGKNAQVNSGANNATAIGNTATVDTNAVDGVAIGTNSLTSAANSVALGPRSTANVTNSVALGAGSTTTVQSGNSYITNVAASTTNGVVSVGSATNTRRIQNVADGAADSDAVTVAQLKDVNNRAVGNTTALGGGAAYNPATDVYTPPSYTITKTDGTTYTPVNTVSGALTNLNNEVVKPITFAGNTGSSANNLGTTLNITGGGSTAGTYSGNNLKTAVTGNTVNIQMADAPVFSGTVTAGNLTTGGSLNVTGASNLNGGANLNNQKITNLAAGTISSTSTDAVNGSQLNTTNQNVTTAQNTANTAVTNAAAAQNTANTAVTNAAAAQATADKGLNLGDAITALDKGWTLQSNGTNAAAVKAGDTVDIGTVAGETNLNVTKTGNTIQYGLNRDLNIDSVTAGDSKLDTNGLTIAGGPSVTKTGIDAAGNTISNVAAGTNATDAVNKGQLDHVDNRVTQVTNTTASIFGGGAKANTDGSISNPTYNVAGTSANNVGDALTALDKAVTDAGTAANAGWTVSANGDAATAKKIKPNGKVNFTGDDNLTVAQSSETDNEGNIKVALNKNLKVDSVTTGNTVIDTTGVKVGDNVQLGSTGLIIAGGPSITTSGISAGNKTISNVAAGVSSTDAVNKGQLDSAISSINNNVGALANSAVQYDKNSDGSVNKDSITLAGGANGTTIKNVANGTVAEGSKDAVNGGQLWTVQQQVNKNTGDISNLQTDISNINNGKSGLVQQADKDAAITVGKDTGGTQVNVAGTAGERTVTGVKAGAVTESSKDAVNGSQLNTTNQALVNYLGGGAGYDNITQSFSNPTYNVGDQSYHNVGDAIGALNQADQTLNTKIDNVSNKLEQAFYATNQRIDDVEKRANAGIAAAMALENAPFVAGKYTYAVGAAYHGGENAVGVTLRKTADNGRWSLTGGVAAASQGDPSVRIGISGVID